MPGLAGDFYERGKKLQSLAELMSVDSLRNHIFVIRDDPAHLVGTTIAPEYASDRPDIALRAAMRARAYRRASIEREWNHIVRSCSHDLNLITDQPSETVIRLSGQPLSPIYLWNL